MVIGMFSNNRIYIIIKVRSSAYNDNKKYAIIILEVRIIERICKQLKET